jgi:ankyrin repeat protein
MQRTDYPDMLRRFLGPVEFAQLVLTYPSLPTGSMGKAWQEILLKQGDDGDSNSLLHFLGGTDCRQKECDKLRDVCRRQRSEFSLWCQAMACRKGEWGELPLHRASRSGSALNVHVLLELYPEAITTPCLLGNLPLHCAVLASNERVVYLLLARSPGAVRVSNHHQGLPLHCAVQSYVPCRVVRTLLRSYPQAVAVTNPAHGQTPLHIIHRQYLKQDYCQVAWWMNELEALDKEEAPLFLFQTALGKADHKGRLALHVALEQDSLHLPQMQALLAVSPPVAFAQGDIQGRLPLHAVCQNGQNGRRLRFISELVQVFPGATAIANIDGRVPLAAAVSSKLHLGIIYFLDRHTPEALTLPIWKDAAVYHPSVSVLYTLLRRQPAGVFLKHNSGEEKGRSRPDPRFRNTTNSNP